MEGFKRDLKWSQQAFIQLVWPCVKYFLGNGLLKSVELYTEKGFARELDTLAGVDAWQVMNEEGIRALAQRTQKIKAGYEPFNTFTIREKRLTGAKTEFEKLTRAIIVEPQRGFLHPAITCQAYVDEDLTQCLSACLVRTKDLISFAHSHYDSLPRNYHDNDFLIVPWGRLKEEKVPIRTYPYPLPSPS